MIYLTILLLTILVILFFLYYQKAAVAAIYPKLLHPLAIYAAELHYRGWILTRSSMVKKTNN
ncbi:hypothetical protein [Neobacillus drentensis]|uniref:hypothetical protein n=1 Tax=Neobacillus drentensis TaxID=220684 RepID=UPI0030003A0C